MDFSVPKRARKEPGSSCDGLGIFATLPSVWDLPSGTRFGAQSPLSQPSSQISASPRCPSATKAPLDPLELPKTPPESSSKCNDENQDALYSARGPAPISQRKDRLESMKSLSKELASQIMSQDVNLTGPGVKFSYRAFGKQSPRPVKQKSAPAELITANIFPLLGQKSSSIASARVPLTGVASEVSSNKIHKSQVCQQHAPPEHKTPSTNSGGGRACMLWKKYGGERLTNRELALATVFKDLDEFSLRQAAKDRSTYLSPLNSARDEENRSSLPTRSVSWDVGMVVQSLGLKDRLDPERFEALNIRLQEMLTDDEERIYTGSYGPKSLRRINDRRVMKCLVEANPVAFVEDAAVQAEEEYRAAAAMARNNLNRLSLSPDNQRVCGDLTDDIKNLRKERPYFSQPKPPHEVPKRLEVEEKKRERPKWQCDTSLFGQRKKENDSRGLFDTEKVLKRQFMLDWERIVCKSRFRRLVGREDAGVRKEGQGLEEELEEVREELYAKRDILRMAFIYYSMMSGYAHSSNVLQLSLNQWTIFTQDCYILDPKSLGSKAADLDTMFVSTNFEEESGTHDAEANDDDALVRFEFHEILIRASFGKYITPKILDDSSDSVKRLLEEKLLVNLPQEARLNPNDFRRDRFYTREMEAVLKFNWDLLNATFKLYKAKDKTKYFWIEHWIILLEAVGLMGSHTGLEKREAKLIFAWSQMTVVDELKKRQRAVSLMFFDFVEALARAAELISPPTEEEMEEFFAVNGPPTGPNTSRLYDYYNRVGSLSSDLRRPSGYLCATPTRPLHEKFVGLMELLLEGLKPLWGGSTKEQVVDRMRKMASRLSGGIELG